MAESPERPEVVFHICSPEAAGELELKGELAPPSLDDEGFVHGSTAEQLMDTAHLYFTDATRLVVLCLATARLGAELRWEVSRDELEFPHVYRALKVSDIIGWRRLSRATTADRFELDKPLPKSA